MNESLRGKLLAAAAVATLLLLTPAASGTALRSDSFSGSCSVQGTDYFTPPVNNTQQHLILDYRAHGTCSGMLDGHKLSDAAVTMHSHGRSDGTCSQAKTPSPGNGTLSFGHGRTIRYTVTFTSLLTEVDLSFRGSRSGSAHGHATFLTQRTQPTVISGCAGKGDSQVPMDLSLATDRALVSARPPSKRHHHKKRNHYKPRNHHTHLRHGARRPSEMKQ